MRQSLDRMSRLVREKASGYNATDDIKVAKLSVEKSQKDLEISEKEKNKQVKAGRIGKSSLFQ